MPRAVLMCGPAGSGKSTYARGLERQGWLRLSVDRAAQERGYTAAPLPEGVLADIHAEQRRELVAALHAGRDVVVDHAFWSRAARDDYRSLARAAGAEVEVVHLDVPLEELLRRLAARNAEPFGADRFHVGEELLRSYVEGFEVPGRDETDVRVVRPTARPERALPPPDVGDTGGHPPRGAPA